MNMRSNMHTVSESMCRGEEGAGRGPGVPAVLSRAARELSQRRQVHKEWKALKTLDLRVRGQGRGRRDQALCKT